MSRNKLILIGAGVPLLIALATVGLLEWGVFSDENSKSLAMVIIIGGGLAGLLILLFAFLQKLNDLILQKLNDLI